MVVESGGAPMLMVVVLRAEVKNHSKVVEGLHNKDCIRPTQAHAHPIHRNYKECAEKLRPNQLLTLLGSGRRRGAAALKFGFAEKKSHNHLLYAFARNNNSNSKKKKRK